MAEQSLLAYLSVVLPALPVHATTPWVDRVDMPWRASDITEIMTWKEFTYAIIVNQYGDLLNTARSAPKQVFSPPRAIPHEGDVNFFRVRYAEYVLPRIRRSLRAGFNELQSQPQLQGQNQFPRLLELTVDGGSAARYVSSIKDFRSADNAFITPDANSWIEPNREPGCFKVNVYKRALAQVNWYMRQYGARYGFILSNEEFLAVKRLDADGRVAVSEPVLWSDAAAADATGTGTGTGRLSVLMGIWYVGMLAVDEDHWRL
ncbi:hypothetical protein BDW74DRAFT_187918 [Aspergillus multicolor]|uniref:uncharacterized protein n=1 Tax=Aspergillus multicolor TaxID=41759 RepID=UPI003CCD5CE9